MKTLFIIVAGLAVLLLVGGGYFYLNYLRPIVGMAPTGAFHVGTTVFDYEYDAEISDVSRKLNIKAWYPTHVKQGELDVMQSPKTALAVVKIFDMPKFLATSDPSHSYIDAKIAEDEAHYPVVIFNHGFASFPTQNTVQMQELASHGYIVLSIAHPDISLVTEYTNGDFVDYDANHPAYKAFDGQSTELGIIGAQLGEILEHAKLTKDFESHWQVMTEFSDIEIYASLKTTVEQWIEDTSAVVNLIASGEGARLTNAIGAQMSPDKIGLLGHSLGGVTSTFTNYTNDNVAAAINLDAPPIYTTDLASLNFGKPTCHMMSDVIDMGGNVLDFRQINRPTLEESTAFGCNAVFKGAAHLSFTDMNYVAVMKLAGQLGKVDQKKMGEELNHMILWYFDKMLKENDVAYTPMHHEIVDIETFNE